MVEYLTCEVEGLKLRPETADEVTMPILESRDRMVKSLRSFLATY